jgi:hypothetical protein
LRRNYILKHIIEEKVGGIEVTGRQGRRYKQLLDNLKERIGYLKFKDEALHCILWRRYYRQTIE